MTNILMILADDMGQWALGSSGNPEVLTPNLDKLAEKGVSFNQFFCTSPVCSPARASILMGTMPSAHGITDWLRSGNLDPAMLSPEEKKNYPDEFAREYLYGLTAYTDVLSSRGYDCALSGKWHMGNSQRPQKGINRQKIIAQGGCHYYYSPMINEKGDIYHTDGYITDVITDNALAYLKEMTDSDRPFYLSVHYTAPHTPWEKEEHPANIWSLYENCPFSYIKSEPIHPYQSPTCSIGHTPEEAKELLRGYYTAITAMDANIGRLLSFLQESGKAEDTLVVFMGDNGMNLGQHGVWGKGNGTLPLNMYDSSLLVPLIISQPSRFSGGRVCSQMLSQYDFLPTLLDYCGFDCDIPSGLPGISFSSLLLNESASVEHDAVVSQFAEYGPVRMIRSREWKLVTYAPYDQTPEFTKLSSSLQNACLRGEDALFDLINDPEERINRIQDPSCKEIAEKLRRELGEWFTQYGTEKEDGRHHAVTGFGQTW